jgi:hypothetical protein
MFICTGQPGCGLESCHRQRWLACEFWGCHTHHAHSLRHTQVFPCMASVPPWRLDVNGVAHGSLQLTRPGKRGRGPSRPCVSGSEAALYSNRPWLTRFHDHLMGCPPQAARTPYGRA